MLLRDYFVGQPVRLQSSHSPRVVAERINSGAASIFWPFHWDAVVGGVWLGRIRLRFVNSPFEYNAKPLLAGRLCETSSGSILKLRYRAPAWIYAFALFWYCALGLLILMALGQFGERNPDLTSGDTAFTWAIILALVVTPIAFHYFGTRNANKELGYLLDFLAERADATNLVPISTQIRRLSPS